MTLQEWVIKELRGLIATMNENTRAIDVTIANAERRLTSLEDRVTYLERVMMGRIDK